MVAGSGQFSGQRAQKPHLLRGTGGLQAEVSDLRADIARDMVANVAMAVDEWSAVAAADVNAIKVSIASAAVISTYTGAALDGVVGTGTMDPPRNITITTSSHADIDAVAVVITGTDVNGDALTESITLTDAGNTTDSGLSAFASVSSIVVPAQGGTGGALEFGFGNIIGLSKPLASKAGYSALLKEIVNGVLVSDLVVQTYVDPATADVDAIVATPRATSASEDTLSGPTILDGIIGDGGAISPPRNISIVSDAHADFDAVVAVVTGTDILGNVITGNITITDGGAATDVSVEAFASVTQIVIPAQGGTGGTYTVGFGTIIGLSAPIRFLNGDPQVLSENEAGTPLGVDVLGGTYVAAATAGPNGTYDAAAAPDATVDYALVYVADRGVLADAATGAPNGTYTPAIAPLGAENYAVYYEYDASANT